LTCCRASTTRTACSSRCTSEQLAAQRAHVLTASPVLLQEWFSENRKALIVTELIRGCEVLEARSVRSRQNKLSHARSQALTTKGTYTEDDARVVVRQLVSGLAYLHSKNIMHRDLKLENLMLSKPGDITSGLKIVDYGLARVDRPFDDNDVCGTPMYVAPEVLGKPGPKGTTGAAAITIAVDMWSVGVILYMLLSGFPPFSADTDTKLFSLIRRGRYALMEYAFANISPEAKQLIQSLLVVPVEGRPTAKQVEKHTWFGAALEAPTLDAAAAGLKRIMARRKLKGTFSSVLSVVRMQKAIGGLASASSDASPASTEGGTPSPAAKPAAVEEEDDAAPEEKAAAKRLASATQRFERLERAASRQAKEPDA
jgi:serine/threonine protein kinase